MLAGHPSDRSEVDFSAVLTRAGGAMATRERERENVREGGEGGEGRKQQSAHAQKHISVST